MVAETLARTVERYNDVPAMEKSHSDTGLRPSRRSPVLVALVVGGVLGLGGCRSLYYNPAIVGEGDGARTKVVLAKREPDRLIAEDLTVCWVVPDVFKGVRPGDHWRCDWRYIPPGM